MLQAKHMWDQSVNIHASVFCQARKGPQHEMTNYVLTVDGS